MIISSIKRTGDDGLSMPHAIFLSLISALFSLALPFSMIDSQLSEGIFWIVCLAFGILVILTSKKFSSVLILSLVMTFVNSYTGSPAVIALVVGTVAACGIYSALVSAARSWQIGLLALTPAISFAVTLALTSDVILAIIALAPYLPSLVMGIGTRRGVERSFSIASFALVCGAEIGICALIHICTQNGYLSLEVIGESANYFQTVAGDLFISAIETAGNVPVTEDILIQMQSLALDLTNLLVGIVSASLIIFGFFAQRIQHSVFEKYELEKLQNMSGAPIRASVTAALVFAAAHIFSYTSGASSSPSFVAAVGANISLILMPLLLYVGFEFVSGLPKKIGFLALIVWLGAAVAAFLLSSSLIDIIALVGAIYTVLVNINLWAEEHYRKGED